MSAHIYFEKYLRPNFEEWSANPLDERRAMNAVLSLNHMADWFYFRDCAGLPRIQATKKMNEFRTSLIEKCDDF